MARLLRGGALIPPRRDGALSDVLGSMMMLAVTVSLFAGALLALPHDDDAEDVDALDVRYAIEASPGATTLTMRHLGGDAAPLGALRASVLAGAEALAHGATPVGADPWTLGGEIQVALVRALRPGDALDVVLLRDGSGAILPGSLRVPEAAPSATAPLGAGVEVTFRVGGDYLLDNSTRSIYLEARLVNVTARSQVASVFADLTDLRAPPWVELADDGTRGDALAGDGVYTLAYLPPPDIPPGVHEVEVTALLVSGSAVTGDAQVLVTKSLIERPRFDASLYTDIGWSLEKLDRKDVLLTLKMRADTAHTLVAGVDSRLAKMRIQTTIEDKAKDMQLRCESGGIVVLQYRGELRHYRPFSDVLQYYFQVEWRPNPGGSPAYTTIEAEPPLLYFSMRASEVEQTWGHPWEDHATCG